MGSSSDQWLRFPYGSTFLFISSLSRNGTTEYSTDRGRITEYIIYYAHRHVRALKPPPPCSEELAYHDALMMRRARHLPATAPQ
eukprot:COSAG01_NODE_4364_length_5094_cov_26.560561_3_plen_84_part_00